MSFFPELIPKVGNDNNWVGSADQLAQYEQRTRYWMEAAYEEAKFDYNQSDEVNEVNKYIDYLMGKQWPGNRPSYKSKPVNNRVWRLWWELVALLTDLKPTFAIKETEDKYEQIALKLNKAMRAWWLENDADLSVSLVVMFSMLSTGYAKLEWDPSAKNGLGDMRMLPLSGESVLPLKPLQTLESSQALIYQAVVPTSFVRRKYPMRAHVVEADASLSRYELPQQLPPGVGPALYSMLAPQMKRLISKGSTTRTSVFPMCLYREFWIQDPTLNTTNKDIVMGSGSWRQIIKPTQMLYPRGRLLVMAGRNPVHDGPNPYWHGKYPFSALRLNVVPWQWAGVSELRPQIPLQDIVNNIFAGVIDMIKKAVNPGFMAPKNAFSDAFWQTLDWSMPGAKGAYNPNTVHAPQFTPAPQLPGFVFQMLGNVYREMDQSSGLASISEAVRKNQIPGADTLEQIKATQQTPIRLKGRHIESFLRSLGSQAIANFFQFYPEKRRMFLLGGLGDFNPVPFDWNRSEILPAGMEAEEFMRNFVMFIQPGSSLNVTRQQELQGLFQLRATRDIDRQTFLDKLDMGLNAAEIEQRLAKEAQSQPPPQLGRRAAGVP